MRNILPFTPFENDQLPNRVFHILDSLPGLGGGTKDADRLQRILLKHFEKASFEEGRITTNFAQVIGIISSCNSVID